MSEREAALVQQRELVDRMVAFYRWDASVDLARAVLAHRRGCKCPVCS